MKTLSYHAKFLYHVSCTTAGEFRAEYLKGRTVNRVERFLQIYREIGEEVDLIKMLNHEITDNIGVEKVHSVLYRGVCEVISRKVFLPPPPFLSL